MAENPLAIRVSEEVKTLFNELSERGEFDNKGEFLNRLLVSYQSELTKKDVSMMKPAIETVEALTTRLLELLNGTAAAITTRDEKHIQELDEQKKSFEETRTLLQQRITSLEQDKITDEERIQGFIEDKDAAERRVTELQERIKELEQAVTDKQALIEEYKNKNDTLTSIVEEYKEAAVENKKLHIENAGYVKDFETQESQIKTLKDKLEEQETRHSDELERLKDTLHIEREKALLELRTTHQRESQAQQESYNDKIKSLLERLEVSQTVAPKEPSTRKKKAIPNNIGEPVNN